MLKNILKDVKTIHFWNMSLTWFKENENLKMLRSVGLSIMLENNILYYKLFKKKIIFKLLLIKTLLSYINRYSQADLKTALDIIEVVFQIFLPENVEVILKPN